MTARVRRRLTVAPDLANLTCERCGADSACTNLEIHVIGSIVCTACRNDDEIKALATEAYLNAEYEVDRLLANRHGIRPDGSPGPKLAQAMAQRDFHLARVIGGPVIPVLVHEVRPERRKPIPKPIHRMAMIIARRVGVIS